MAFRSFGSLGEQYRALGKVGDYCTRFRAEGLGLIGFRVLGFGDDVAESKRAPNDKMLDASANYPQPSGQLEL